MTGRKITGFLAGAGIVLAMGSFLMHRSAPADNGPDNSGADDRAVQLSGSIRMVGSSSMEKLANALAESFMDKYPNITITVQFTGSSAGIAAVAGGSADIGNSSRYLKEEEKAEGMAENIVALDGIAVCVDPSNTISGLTYQQLKDIFTGRITNWSALTDMDLPIVVVGREAGSGTRSAFEELLGIEDQCTYANEVDSTGAVMARIASTPGAIGYVSFDTFVSFDTLNSSNQNKNTVKALSLDGVEPNAENVKSGSYPLCRPFVMAVKGELSVQSRLVQVWFDYVYSEAGQEIAAKAGLVTVDREFSDKDGERR